MKRAFYLFSALLLTGMLTRLLPHWPNFTAVGAVALAGGALYRDRWAAFLLPVTLLFISDLLVNNLLYADFYSGFTWFTPGAIFIYGGFLLMVLIGRYGIGGQRSFIPVLGASLGGSLVFYLVSNFGVWLGGSLYPLNLSGLLASYVAGLPFLLNQALATGFYSALIFGLAWYVLPRYSTQLSELRL